MDPDFDDIVEIWEKRFQDDQLTPECFKEFWKQCVPLVYKISMSGEGVPRTSIDEEKHKTHLFSPLSRFFYNGDANSVHMELKKLESSTTACGHVFRYGESTYTCRDCAMDSTCVLCVDCFKYSVHRHHRYKMGSSIGGGCCDCGDVEAWKADPWCEIHKSKSEEETPQGTSQADDAKAQTDHYAQLEILDQTMVKRMECIFNAACRYAFDILTYYNYQIIPEGLNPQSSMMPELVDQDPVPPNTYCTILYNDESHTYEQVTNAVVRVIMCPQKTAMDLVTQVDRDGRALIKYGEFQSCYQVHEEVQRYLTRFGHTPLKTLILHSTTVAHQNFALDLLAWMEERVKTYKSLRLIFSRVAMKQTRSSRNSILEGIMLRDSRMWKYARMQWNHLFFNGLLMEYQTKKAFAKILTQNYGLILKDFMSDDHDHSFSIASLSVQVYTVPSLALYLIEYEEVLYTLLNTFFSECVRLCNVDMKLVLGRNPHVQQFKRSHYVLYDLRYLLSQKPTSWSTSLRRSFLHGFSMFLKVLTLMQGMEAFSRCLYEHAEYEQEWESAFYLHCKMAFVISLMHEWCGEDKVVLIKAYKATLKKIQENPLAETEVAEKQHTVAGHDAFCLEYDVSRKQVSIHIPLTRLLAALHLHLYKFELDFHSPELDFSPRPTIIQVLEPVLRQQALIAQVHANMWRRNGMNLPNQLQWYANSKCRNEMLDCDVVMMQTAASIMDPNVFIITLLGRFNLVNWAQDDYCHELQGPEDDSLRQVITLAEELLGVLITIVGERFMPGVGQVTAQECLCHEIVQQLCIKPMTHSELNQCLHKDFNHETGLETVVDIVASLKEQTQGKKQYELKPERNCEFNLFFYHFTREDRSKAEENQRKQRKQAKELECCPPPLPPPFTAAYRRVGRLLHCDVMFAIIKNVIYRTLNLRNSCFSELQLQETLYLMGYALLEEERKLKCAKSKTQSGDVNLWFTTRAEKMRILPLLMEDLLKCPRVEAQGQIPLITWILCKFRQVLRLRDVTSEQLLEEGDSPKAGTSHDEEAAKKAKESRSEWVAKHRARTLQQMQAMQANFMKENAQLLAVVEAEMKAEDETCVPYVMDEPCVGPAVALGSRRGPAAPLEARFTCILCQATEVMGALDARPMVMAALVQESTVLCRKREKPGRFRNDGEDEFAPMPCAAMPTICLTPNLGPAPHTSSCGHKMHTDCFNKYYENAVAKESRRSFRRLAPPFDVERQEFMCPLCNNLSNSALPVIQPIESLSSSSEQQAKVDLTLEEWVTVLNTFSSLVIYPAETSVTTCYFNPLTYLHVYDTPSLEELVRKLPADLGLKLPTIFPKEKQMATSTLRMETWSFVERFTNSVFLAATGREFHNEDVERLGYLWQSVAYTIHAMEWIQRDESKALLGQFTTRQEEMLRALLLAGALHPAQMQQNVNCNIDPEGEQGSSWFPGSNHFGLTVNIATGMIRTILQPGTNHHKLYPSILEWDSVGLMVCLSMSMPYLFMEKEQVTMSLPACDTKDAVTLQLVLLAHMTSLLICMMTSDEPACPMDVDGDVEMTESEGQEAFIVLQCIYQQFKMPEIPNWITPAYIWHKLTKDCIPFLRCSAILYRYLSGVAPPPSLTLPGGDTYKELCGYLGLPSTCKQLLGQEGVLPLVKNWISGKRIEEIVRSGNFIKGPVEVNELVNLPKDFMDLINSVSIFSCPVTHEESRNPTMCLVCGDMVCLQSYCCQGKVKNLTLGPSMYHAYQCGAGVGLFLRVRECEALVLNSPHRGCFVTPPYVDKYGETDEGLRRGNPLYLCPKSYKELQTQWLAHSLSQAIGRNYDEMNHRHLAYQWRAL